MASRRHSPTRQKTLRYFVCVTACYGALCQPIAFASNEGQAVDHALRAVDKQLGVSDRIADNIEQQLPEELKKKLGPVAPVIKALIDKRIEIKVTF